MVELYTTNTIYSRCRQRNSVEYSRELPKIAECAARLPHVQTRVINSGTHLRIHTAELRGLQNNEISRANYTRGEEGLPYWRRNLQDSRAQTSVSGKTRKSRARLLIIIRILCIEEIVINKQRLNCLINV